MNENYSGEKAIAQRNVLSTEEVCKIIGRSRQQLNNLIRHDDIEVFKTLSNGNLFWRPEVYELLRKINREQPRQVHRVYGGSTEKALRAFHTLDIDAEHVEEVYIFFSHRDAILKNFYNIKEVEMPNTLTRVEGARFILIMDSGEEVWFEGLTCGYSGAGCVGAEYALSELGIIEKADPINSIISSNRMLHFYRNEGKTWEYTGEPSLFEEHGINSFSEDNLLGIEEDLYRYNGYLVLTQSSRYRNVFGEVPEPSKAVLFKSLYFVPNPVSVEFLTEEDAMSTGHFQTSYGNTVIYQIIIRDVSDRELWLNYPFKEIPKNKQHNMKELLNVLGVKVEEQTLADRFLDWLNARPRNIYRHYDL